MQAFASQHSQLSMLPLAHEPSRRGIMLENLRKRYTIIIFAALLAPSQPHVYARSFGFKITLA